LLCIDQEKFDNHENSIIVFTLTPYLIGILHTLQIPYSQAKRRILSAIDKDLSNCKNFTKKSNLYNLLVNEFGIKVRQFNNFVSVI
jgi:hypothetical protein